MSDIDGWQWVAIAVVFLMVGHAIARTYKD